jgi:uncharacterized membrane protein
LGVFYFNPDDPALFVGKRFGVGFSSNFTRPLSWLLFAGVLVLCGGLAVASILLLR